MTDAKFHKILQLMKAPLKPEYCSRSEPAGTGNASIWETESISFLYREFEKLNNAHFGGKLPYPQIIIADCGADIDGYYRKKTDTENEKQIPIICLSALLFSGADWQRISSDVLLHECIHMRLSMLRNNDPDYCHGRAFRQECNRIGQALGLPKVYAYRSRKNRKSREYSSPKFWPTNVRRIIDLDYSHSISQLGQRRKEYYEAQHLRSLQQKARCFSPELSKALHDIEALLDDSTLDTFDILIQAIENDRLSLLKGT